MAETVTGFQEHMALEAHLYIYIYMYTYVPTTNDFVVKELPHYEPVCEMRLARTSREGKEGRSVMSLVKEMKRAQVDRGQNRHEDRLSRLVWFLLYRRDTRLIYR